MLKKGSFLLIAMLLILSVGLRTKAHAETGTLTSNGGPSATNPLGENASGVGAAVTVPSSAGSQTPATPRRGTGSNGSGTTNSLANVSFLTDSLGVTVGPTGTGAPTPDPSSTGPQSPVLGSQPQNPAGTGDPMPNLSSSGASGQAYATKIPVILYHRILKNSENKLYRHESDVISYQKFKEEMKILHDAGYHTVTKQELEDFLAGKIKLPKRSVMIQFDDGRLDEYRYAYAIFKQYGFHAESNLITSRQSREQETWNANENQFLSWDEVKTMSDVFEWGGHTNQLHFLTKNHKTGLVTPTISDAKKLADLKENRKLANGSLFFAYPWGQYNADTIHLLKEAGFKYCFTTKEGYIYPHDNTYELNRFTIAPWISISKFKQIIGLDPVSMYKDLSIDNPNYPVLAWAHHEDVLSGYTDGTFHPYKPITRKNAALALAKALHLKLVTLSDLKASPYTDVPLDSSDQTFVQVAATLKQDHIMTGYRNGSFKPDQPISRQEVATILVQAFQLKGTDHLVTVKDLSQADDSLQYNITLFAERGITSLPDGNFYPNKKMNRLDYLIFLKRLVTLNSQNQSAVS